MGIFDLTREQHRHAVSQRVVLAPLNFSFSVPPLLVGGLAMEYYGLRPAGSDIDLVITVEDYDRLAGQYPDNLKNLWGDLGVCVHGFEIWRTIWMLDYAFLSEGAHEEAEFIVISFERLLLMRVGAMAKPKYHADLELMRGRMEEILYGKLR